VGASLHRLFWATGFSWWLSLPLAIPSGANRRGKTERIVEARPPIQPIRVSWSRRSDRSRALTPDVVVVEIDGGKGDRRLLVAEQSKLSRIYQSAGAYQEVAARLGFKEADGIEEMGDLQVVSPATKSFCALFRRASRFHFLRHAGALFLTGPRCPTSPVRRDWQKCKQRPAAYPGLAGRAGDRRGFHCRRAARRPADQPLDRQRETPLARTCSPRPTSTPAAAPNTPWEKSSAWMQPGR